MSAARQRAIPRPAQSVHEFRIGADENGLGARLGPMIVTGVLARVNTDGQRCLARRLPARIAADLGDSKQLVSHKDARLGEAWARALVGRSVESPAMLFEEISLEGSPALRQRCPHQAEAQCWAADDEPFVSDAALVARLRGHLDQLRKRGVDVVRVVSSVACTLHLNLAYRRGQSRFVVDLHAMEGITLALREHAGADVFAVCGKVGGMGDYARFFGPLGGRLHVELERTRARSAYRFPGLGELHFVMDADGRDPLVMLASLVGKYIRELLMSRIARYYAGSSLEHPGPSGYHDPVTNRFVSAIELTRRTRGVPEDCFERLRDARFDAVGSRP